MAQNESPNASGYLFSPTELSKMGARLYQQVTALAVSDPALSMRDTIGDETEENVALAGLEDEKMGDIQGMDTAERREGMTTILVDFCVDTRAKEMRKEDGATDTQQLKAFREYVTTEFSKGGRQGQVDQLYATILGGKTVKNKAQMIDKVMKVYARLRSAFDADLTEKTFQGEPVGEASREELRAALAIDDPALRRAQEETREGLARDMKNTERTAGAGGRAFGTKRYQDPHRRNGTDG